MFNKETISKNLPSRTVIAFVLVPSLTFVGIWYILNKPAPVDPSTARTVAFAQALDEGIGEYNERDTDGDLLKDWEEFLYETDINKLDTDGDGLDDYQEALDPIRDPLVADSEKGRYQASSSDEFATNTQLYYTEDPSLTATDIFGRDIMTSFVQLQRADAFRTSVQDTVVQKVAESAIDRDNRETFASMDDLQIVEDNSKRQQSLYKESYIQATKTLDPVKDHDYLLLAYYTEGENTDFLSKLITNANAYENFVEQLSGIKVPSDIAEVHLEVVNNFAYLTDSVRVMSGADTDPLGALIAANKYRDDEKAIDISLQALALYFNKID